MGDYSSCPNCGEGVKETFSSSWRPVYKCRDCGKRSCSKCGGKTCPKCGSTKASEDGKIYAR